MRTSLNEIKEAESFLHNKMNSGDSLVFQAKMITTSSLRTNVILQRKLMDVVQLFHRRKVKRELQSVHKMLMQSSRNSEFQILIKTIFHS